MPILASRADVRTRIRHYFQLSELSQNKALQDIYNPEQEEEEEKDMNGHLDDMVDLCR